MYLPFKRSKNKDKFVLHSLAKFDFFKAKKTYAKNIPTNRPCPSMTEATMSLKFSSHKQIDSKSDLQIVPLNRIITFFICDRRRHLPDVDYILQLSPGHLAKTPNFESTLITQLYLILVCIGTLSKQLHKLTTLFTFDFKFTSMNDNF